MPDREKEIEREEVYVCLIESNIVCVCMRKRKIVSECECVRACERKRERASSLVCVIYYYTWLL